MKLLDLDPTAGTYVSVKLTAGSKAIIEQWMQSAPIECFPLDYLHCTLLYSRKVITALPKDTLHFAAPIGFDIFDNYLVLTLDGPSLTERHLELRALGGTHDYDDFKAHMSIAENVPNSFDLSQLKPISTMLSFENEKHEPLIV